MSYVAFLLSAQTHQEILVSLLKMPRKPLDTLLSLLDDRPPSMFPLYLDVYIFHYTRSKLINGKTNYSTQLSRKICCSLYQVNICYYVLFALSLGRI